MARKPLIGTVAENVLQHGTGALNVDACRISTTERQSVDKAETPGRWPANIIHDGSDDVLRAFAAYGNAPGQQRAVTGDEESLPAKNVYGTFGRSPSSQPRNDAGTAARFFYSAKADAADRLGSKHPTVKPIDLIAYLLRLVTPPGGVSLDPFAGSGTTGMAALREGFSAALIEREDEYVADIRRRIGHVSGQDTPLFCGEMATGGAEGAPLLRELQGRQIGPMGLKR